MSSIALNTHSFGRHSKSKHKIPWWSWIQISIGQHQKRLSSIKSHRFVEICENLSSIILRAIIITCSAQFFKHLLNLRLCFTRMLIHWNFYSWIKRRNHILSLFNKLFLEFLFILILGGIPKLIYYNFPNQTRCIVIFIFHKRLLPFFVYIFFLC